MCHYTLFIYKGCGDSYIQRASLCCVAASSSPPPTASSYPPLPSLPTTFRPPTNHTTTSLPIFPVGYSPPASSYASTVSSISANTNEWNNSGYTGGGGGGGGGVGMAVQPEEQLRQHPECTSFEVTRTEVSLFDCFPCKRNHKRRVLPARNRGIYAPS